LILNTDVGVVWIGTTRSLIEGGGQFERIEFKIAALIPDDSKNLTIDSFEPIEFRFTFWCHKPGARPSAPRRSVGRF
ncbi:hypothetical protein T4E_11560, partial [Trichinella pseudospiralis]